MASLRSDQQKLKAAEKAIADKLKQRAKDAEEAKAAEAARLAAEAVREEQKRKADAWIAEERCKRHRAKSCGGGACEGGGDASERGCGGAAAAKLADAAAETAANHAAEDKLKLKSRLGDIDPDYKRRRPGSNVSRIQAVSSIWRCRW